MAERLGLGADRLDRALRGLTELGLVAFRPWRVGHRDGVWQLLPLAQRIDHARGGEMRIGAILAQLGLPMRDGEGPDRQGLRPLRAGSSEVSRPKLNKFP